MKLSGVGIWSSQLRYGDPGESGEAAAELEELGYEAVWIPDAGGPVFEVADKLLGATERIVVATGILNLWMHAPADVATGCAALMAAHSNRFLLGIGVSHPAVVDGDEPGRYRKPLAAMCDFLDALDSAEQPVPRDNRVLAALGPKMLALAAARAGGAHPYLVTPEHTHTAREALGPDPLLVPEQTVILCDTAAQARAIGGEWLHSYLALPNYANNFLRSGFSSDDITSISDRLFDAVIAWGDEEAIARRIREHRAAGADHVCLQVLTPSGLGYPSDEWRSTLEADRMVYPREQWRRIAAAVNDSAEAK
jgi:probable F420-dependent oxidoreductase